MFGYSSPRIHKYMVYKSKTNIKFQMAMAKKMKFSIKHLFSKWDPSRWRLWIWSLLGLDCGFWLCIYWKMLKGKLHFFVQGSKNQILIELGDIFQPKHAVLMKKPSLSNNQLVILTSWQFTEILPMTNKIVKYNPKLIWYLKYNTISLKPLGSSKFLLAIGNNFSSFFKNIFQVLKGFSAKSIS